MMNVVSQAQLTDQEKRGKGGKGVNEEYFRGLNYTTAESKVDDKKNLINPRYTQCLRIARLYR
jgi:hypothetical protein